MTWVIGSPTMFGYCVGLADIQVTFPCPDGSKKYLDCIQKIQPIGKFIVAGFSGSVKIGFSLMDDLKRWAVLPLNVRVCWIPDCLVLKWKRRARRIYKILDPKKQNPTQILLLGVYPTSDNGIPGFSKTYGCIMKSPDFEPEIITPNTIGSIGSGNNVDEFKKTLSENSGGYNPMMQSEVQNPGGYGFALSIVLSTKAIEKNVPGISGHFHVCEVRRGNITIGPNDHTEYSTSGKEIIFKMPEKIATNWTEFKKIAKENGISCIANAVG